MPHPNEKQPLMEKPVMSVFTPGVRRRMNVIPMVVLAFVPWFVFNFLSFLFAFEAFHYHSQYVIIVFCLATLVWIGLLGFAYLSAKHDLDPMWLKTAVIMFGMAIFGGAFLGYYTYTNYSKIFFSNQDLLSYPNVNPFLQRGADLIDAGRVNFAEGTHLDFDRSWHFKDRSLWCVIPIVSNDPKQPDTGSYDFWAVGKECCSISSSDFRCGDFQDPNARSGMRALDDVDQQMYLLAVQQAETLYDVVASNPVFFYWTKDPLNEVKTYLTTGKEVFTLGLVASLFVSFLIVTLVSCCFACIGRRPGTRPDKTPSLI